MSPLHNGLKRRHVLKALGAAAVALVLPSVPVTPGWTAGLVSVVPCGPFEVEITFNMSMPAPWVADIRECARQLAVEIDQRALAHAYRGVVSVNRFFEPSAPVAWESVRPGLSAYRRLA